MFVRLLFLATVFLAALLIGLVVVAPWLDADSYPAGWERLLSVFAGDTLVRRTALASAAGLLVTAFVFFRRRRGPQTPDAPSRA
ncbi:MAG TPA: hypothetical protein VKE98_11850 [Gemmataceae bacterium]|nr:hypothetical protein [Gemmataceae bacterium]